MYNNETMVSCESENAKQETAKSILESMDAIINEIGNVLDLIERGIYSPKPMKEQDEPHDECILGTLNRQRNAMGRLLRVAVHIREGLW